MKFFKTSSLTTLIVLIFFQTQIFGQIKPEIPIEEWTNKTILFVGAHPDDDASSHGLFAMLTDHGNEVYVILLTAGNVGTKDPNISAPQLAEIRKNEEIQALKAVGVPASNYINFGYTDGMLNFADQEEIVKQIVYYIRKLKPDVYVGFDPGFGFKYWNKTDHVRAAELGTDAVRAAEWRLLFPGQITDGLSAHWIPEALFFRGKKEYAGVKLDITKYVDRVVKSQSAYISQFSSGWYDYKGPKLSDYPGEKTDAYLERIKKRIHANDENGRTYEYFRYYKGKPDGMGDYILESSEDVLQEEGDKKNN